MNINLLFILFYLFTFFPNFHSIEPLASEHSLIEINEMNSNLDEITDNLREKNIKEISKMKQYMVNFSQIANKLKPENVISKIKKYLSRLKIKIRILNKNFKKRNSLCKNTLTLYESQCKHPIDLLESKIKYNKKYVKNLNSINHSIDHNLINRNKSNISCIIKGLIKICLRNNIINTYKKIMDRLRSHFNILVESIQQPIKLSKMDFFVQNMIVRFNNSDYLNGKNQEKEKSIKYLKEKFLKQRSELATILYNKAVTYMNNSIKRKMEMNSIEKGFLTRMRTNDIKLSNNIQNLEKFSKSNRNLIMTLRKEIEFSKVKSKKCEILENSRTKCEEISKIYQSILLSYDEQSESMNRILNLLKN